jgi:putative membrane-bound dehydrogenase-like protein
MGIAIEERWQDDKYAGCRVFVGNSPDLLVLEDTDGDDKADRRYALLTGFGGIDSDHGVHGMVLALDGKLYFTHGDGCCSVQQDKSERAQNFDVVDKSGRHVRSDQLGNTLRVNLDGTQFETLANRQRNNYEAAVDSFGHVFVSDNDDDGNRGVRMLWIMDGGNYGYRTSPRHWGEELPGIVPKLVGTGNGSPCGILVYEGDLFPPEYHGAVLQIDAGTRQVNLHPLTRHGAAFRTEYRVLLAGDDPWFRPVDAAVAPDGSLFVCDWYDGGVGGHRFLDQTTGRIFRVAPKGKAAAAPKLDFATVNGQIAALQSPVVATRFAARQLLVEQSERALPALQKLFQTGTPPTTQPSPPAAGGEGKVRGSAAALQHRGRALTVIAGLGDAGRPTVIAALKDSEPRIREQAVRILTRDVSRLSLVEPESTKNSAPRALAVLEYVLPLANDPDSGVRRELLLALRDVKPPAVPSPQGSSEARAVSAIRQMAMAWDGQDRFYLEAVVLACRNRDSQFHEELFAQAGQKLASAKNAVASRWAMPPYYPVTTNDAFLHPRDELPPASEASKIVGLAWALGVPEALPVLAQIHDAGSGGNLAEGVDIAVAAIRDPRAAEFVAQRFTKTRDVGRRRELVQLLGRKLSNEWHPVLGSEPIRQVLDEALKSDDLRVAAIDAIARCGAKDYAETLAQIARRSDSPMASRQAAIKALGQMRHEPARPLIESLVRIGLSDQDAGPLELAATSALARLESADKGRAFLAGVLKDEKLPLNLRKHAVRELSAMPNGGRVLLDLARKGDFPVDLKTETQTVLHSHADGRLAEDARRDLPLPKSGSGEPLPPIRELLARQGDATRGESVFFRERSDACIRCHRVRGLGNWVGPDLSSIGVKYGKDALLDAILNPSASISFGYQTCVVATTDGRVLTGLIAKQSPEELVLKTAEGQRIAIASADVEERKELNKSVMPDGLAETMTAAELVDLLAYLETLRQPVSTFGQYYVLGPIADSARGSDRFQPNGKIDLTTELPGPRDQTIRWRRVAASDEGRLDLSGILSSKPGESAYVFVPVVSTSDQSAQLVIDTASDVQVWLGGQPLAPPRPTKSAAGTWSTFAVSLSKGASDLVIRVAGGGESPGIVATLMTETPLQFRFDATAQR